MTDIMGGAVLVCVVVILAWPQGFGEALGKAVARYQMAHRKEAARLDKKLHERERP